MKKIKPVRFIMAIAIALLFGVICYYIAPQEDYRQWISFATTTVTMAMTLISAIGINYQIGSRKTNVLTVAWLFSILVLIINISFSFFHYPILLYVAITLLIALIGVLLCFSLSHPTQNNNNM